MPQDETRLVNLENLLNRILNGIAEIKFPLIHHPKLTGAVDYLGNLVAWRNSNTKYTGYIFVPLTAPLTSTNFDGVAFSTTAATLIDLSAEFSAPAGIKAIVARVQCRDSASLTTSGLIVTLSPGTGVNPMTTSPSGLPNDWYTYENGVVPCDGNGDIYYSVTASGSLTMDITITIWGYFI